MRHQADIVAQYVAKRNQTVKTLTENFGDFYDQDHNDLSPLVELINLADRTIQHLLGLNHSFGVVKDQLAQQDKSLDLVQATYSVELPLWGEEKARKWLGNALYLVLGSGYSFNGLFFKGPKGKNLSKLEILQAK